MSNRGIITQLRSGGGSFAIGQAPGELASQITYLSGPEGGATLKDLGSVSSSLRNSFGIDLGDVRAAGLIAIATNPAKAREEFVNARTLSEVRAAGRFKEVLDMSAKLGVPQDQAIEFAREQAAINYQSDLHLLRMRYPFTDDVMQLQQFRTTGRVDGHKKDD